MRSEKQPGGKRTFVEEARRAQLVECAIDAIAELGPARASLSEIARRAGLTKAAIFYHFATRDELIQEVLTTVTSEGAQFMAARLRHSATPAEELATYIAANVDYIATHRRQVRALVLIAINFTGQDGPSKVPHDASVYGAGLAPLQDILRRGQAAGQFTDFNTRTMAMTVRAAIDAIGPQLAAIPDLDLDTYAGDLAALFDRATRGNRS